MEQQVAQLRQLAPNARTDEGIWERHDAIRTGGPLRIKVAALGTHLAAVEKALSPLALDFAWYPTLGIGFAAGAAAEGAAALVSDARAELGRRGGSLVVQAAPDGLRVDLPSILTLWGRLEFNLYVLRNPDFRERVVAQRRTTCDMVARFMKRQAGASGSDGPVGGHDRHWKDSVAPQR